MMPMRDGVRLATDIYRPKNAAGPVPIVFSKTPYNFNYWDVRNRVPADMSTPLAVGEARLRLRRPERARALLLGRQLRHPRRAHHRWLRRHRVADEAVVVERQGGHDRLLVDRGVAAGGRLARASRVCGDERAGLRRRRRTRRARTTSRATGIAAARCRCCSSPGSTASRTRCGRSSRGTPAAKISSPRRASSTWRRRCRRSTGTRRSGTCRRRTS